MAAEVSIAAAGLAAGANALFGYNRHNYLYDRKMRQKQEFRVAAFRNQQADLWREDVRDLIGLTVGKMDTYTIVNALLVALCIEFFTAGRLVPGTPEWLLWLYTASLSGAFAYLLQALWLALHASVAAEAGATRLLTQLVRLPVPSWEQLESMRTYGSSVEGLGLRKLLRVPFVDSLLRGLRGRGQPDSSPPGREDSLLRGFRCRGQPDSSPPGREDAAAADVWDLERRGSSIYELQHKPTQEQRHAQLVRRAAARWQSHEAFARVSMTLGVCQLLYTAVYYCLGQVLVEAGEAWGALFLSTAMAGCVAALLGLDVSLLAREAYTICALVYAGPLLAALAALCWCTYSPSATLVAMGLLPFAFGAHGLLYAYVATMAGGEEQANGAVMPVRWRTVLYVDVFGWLSHRRVAKPKWSFRRRDKAGYSPVFRIGKEDYVPAHDAEACIGDGSSDEDALDDRDEEREEALGETASDELLRELRREIDFWQSEEVSHALSAGGRERAWKCATEFEKLSGAFDAASPSFGSSASPGARRPASDRGREKSGSQGPQQPIAGPVRLRGSKEVASFADGPPSSLAATEERLERLRAEIVAACTGRAESGSPRSARHRDSARTRVKFKDPKDDLLEGVGPPAAVPRAHRGAFEAESYGPRGEDADSEDEDGGALNSREGQSAPWAIFRSLTWLLAGVHFAGALWSVWRFSGHSDIHAKPLPLMDEEMFGSEGGGSIAIATELAEGGVQMSPGYLEMPDVRLSKLVEGSPLETIWPHSNSFEPRGLSCDAKAQRFVVADDFGVYAAQLAARPVSDRGSTRADGRRRLLRARTPEARFEQAPPCRPLEGHTPKDVEILCARTNHGERCSALVLYASGQGVALAECPLQHEADRAAGSWDISVDWLDDLSDESIESVALGHRCHGSATTSAVVEVSPGLRGCVLVGTTGGRLVQLRQHVTKRNELVPLWATRSLRPRSRQAAVASRTAYSHSLHVVPAGYVMVLQPAQAGGLRSGRPGVMLALDLEQDQIVGQWELPKDVQWQSLCGGGGDALYMLGRRAGLGASLWRFPLPPELRRSAPGHGAHGAARSDAAAF